MVTVREKPKGSGIYYLFMHERGVTTSEKVGRSKPQAVALAKQTALRMVRDALLPPAPPAPAAHHGCRGFDAREHHAHHGRCPRSPGPSSWSA